MKAPLPRCRATVKPGKRHQKVIHQATVRRLPEDMQAITDLQFLQVAQESIEFLQRQILVIGVFNAGIGANSRVVCQIQNACFQKPQATRIMPHSFIIFVNEALQILHRTMRLGTCQGRCQMIDDDRRSPTLGLRPLTGIIDDERIDMRHGPKRDFRPAALAQRQCLAGQPFEIAVLAHMDDGMHINRLPQIGIERQIPVWWHEIGRMIGFFRIDVIAARGLNTAPDGSEPHQRQPENAIAKERIILRRAPAFPDRLARGIGHGLEKTQVIGQGQHIADRPSLSLLIGDTLPEERDQVAALFRCILDTVARGFQRADDLERPFRRIETHTVCQPPVLVRIIGEHDGDPPLLRFALPQPRPFGSQPCHESGPLMVRFMGDDIGLYRLIVVRGSLERDGPCQHPAIDLRQRHMHGKIAA